mmetsp:Transcript_109246/g.189544  ORF Transcript_109246/g.189544 Transcript_109246/m.189544 type:complete len:211 (+) Transcript_109246:154-786(+)
MGLPANPFASRLPQSSAAWWKCPFGFELRASLPICTAGSVVPATCGDGNAQECRFALTGAAFTSMSVCRSPDSACCSCSSFSLSATTSAAHGLPAASSAGPLSESAASAVAGDAASSSAALLDAQFPLPSSSCSSGLCLDFAGSLRRTTADWEPDFGLPSLPRAALSAWRRSKALLKAAPRSQISSKCCFVAALVVQLPRDELRVGRCDA